MPNHYKKAKGNSKPSYQGKVTGPNFPSNTGSKKGGSGNMQQTPEKVKSSYKKAKGG